MLSSVARWAGYGAFMVKGLGRAAVRGLLVVIGSVIAYLLGAWAYYAEPWYDNDVIRQLTSAPRTAPWGDVSDEAAGILPDGMTYRAATTLLRANGFSCLEAAADGPQIRLSCRREPHVPLCAANYAVELSFDREELITDRNARFYIVCL